MLYFTFFMFPFHLQASTDITTSVEISVRDMLINIELIIVAVHNATTV